MTILYPTETLYALGVNAFDAEALATLYKLKGREEGKAVSVLVRDIEDIERWAVVSPKAKLLATKFLPGPLTLVLEARDEVPRPLLAKDGTIGFRISSDKIAQAIIKDSIEENQAPLTCTSANVSGLPTLSTTNKILEQFKDKAKCIDKVYDDGVRNGLGSTVVRVVGDEIYILRVGAIERLDIYSTLKTSFDEQL